VLGIAPPPEELLVPKILKQIADTTSQVATGNYHSLVWNKSGIFNCFKLLNPVIYTETCRNL